MPAELIVGLRLLGANNEAWRLPPSFSLRKAPLSPQAAEAVLRLRFSFLGMKRACANTDPNLPAVSSLGVKFFNCS